MLPMLYQLYVAYLTIHAIHGTYVAYVYIRWMLGGMYGASLWLYSWVYEVEEPLLQIEYKESYHADITKGSKASPST